MQPSSRYTYQNAGFNGFMMRSLKSNAGAQTLRGGMTIPSAAIDFDRQQIAGAIGDQLKLGRLNLAGNLGRIIVMDETNTIEVGWMGDLTP